MLTLEQVLAKSEKRISVLYPVVANAARALITMAYKRGVMITIVQGLRTMEEQAALYAQGRTKPGSIVTNAKAGTSYHNYGLAIDFALLTNDGKAVSWDTIADYDKDGTADWMEVVQEGKKLGFFWGGDFKSIMDKPHFEMSFGLTTKQLLAGKCPTKSQIDAAQAKIDAVLDTLTVKEEDEPMTAAEKAKMEELEKTVETLTKAVEQLTLLNKQENVPTWAKAAVDAAFKAKLIDTPTGGSYDFYRILTILSRKGVV